MKSSIVDMKKGLILLIIFLISCGSDGESSNSSSSEEVNNDKFETLDWPLDYPIFEIYECLESKGLSNLPSPETTDSEIQVKFDGGYDKAFFNEFNILIDECEIKINEDDENNDREEAAEVKEEAALEPIVSIGEIVEDDSFLDYHRYIDVVGLRMFILPEVGDEFIYKVSEVYYLMLQEGEHIDQDIRSSYLQTVKTESVFQKIGYEGPERYRLDSDPPGVDCCPGKGYEDNHTDFIWEYPDASADDQIGEVVEHLLHTVTGVAFALEFTEWNWENPNSEIILAMNEAIEKKIFDISSYEEIKNSGNVEDFNRITSIEFAFWGIITEWGYGDLYDLPNDEFTISTPNEVKEELPLFHKLFEDTIKTIFTPPNKDYLRELFR
tara:strand:+ start:187 stop:1332 length:1146 start_codon:yes stop_codon:yes gene_type:complete